MMPLRQFLKSEPIASIGKQLLRSYSNEKNIGIRVVVNQIVSNPLEAIEKLALEPMRAPDLSQLPEDAVIMKVSSSSVHWVDLLMMMGQYQQAPPVPYTPGMEYSGVVVETGKGVKHINPGDRVFVDIFNAGPRSYGKFQTWGGCASFSAAPESAVRLVPKEFDMHQAAIYCGGYETAHHALVHCGKLKPGETVLIHGATGAGGLAATQICTALGANVIVTGGSDEKLDIVKNQCYGNGKILGSYNYNKNDVSLKELVKSLTVKGGGVDVIFDTVGGSKLIQESLRCIKFQGRYCVVGWTSTPFAGGGRASGADQSSANVVPTNLIMMKGAQVIGCPVAIHTRLDPTIRPPRVAAIDALVKEGLIRPYVSHIFPLSKIKDALNAKWGRQVTGCCVVDCEVIK
jgi:NADPH2:quinone reductase